VVDQAALQGIKLQNKSNRVATRAAGGERVFPFLLAARRIAR